MFLFDETVEKASRKLARLTSRRGVLAALGKLMVAGTVLPLLPIDRTYGKTDPHQTDATKCDYWKYCAVDGFLCSCCGGSSNACPPGTAPSPITWIGTCHNPADSRDYIVSYNDCCGKASCGNCECNRNEREKPMYRPSRNNDLNWCMANADSNYHCSVSVILGVAEK